MTSAFHRLVGLAAQSTGATVALVDVGPNVGAINRAALLACDHIVMPLGADLYSLQGLRNVGPTLRGWRREWNDRLTRKPDWLAISLPAGTMAPAGYIIMRHSARLDRPVRAFDKWIARMPSEYAQSVMNTEPQPGDAEADSNRIALLKDFRSLMPMAQEVRKPMFLLKPADGAFGGHQLAVSDCYTDFRSLTIEIAKRCGLTFPSRRTISWRPQRPN